MHKSAMQIPVNDFIGKKLKVSGLLLMMGYVCLFAVIIIVSLCLQIRKLSRCLQLARGHTD